MAGFAALFGEGRSVPAPEFLILLIPWDYFGKSNQEVTFPAKR